jgi:hypothetical protein
MTDLIQFAIVTLAACAAAALIIRPYVVRQPPGRAPGCSTCPSARTRTPPSVSQTQPLRLFRR